MRAVLLTLATCLLLCSGTEGVIPANAEARAASTNATAEATMALMTLGTSNATLAGLIDYLTLAHEAAEPTSYTSYAGQQTGTIGAAAAAGAALLAGTVALNNASEARGEAEAALSAANTLVAAIVDEDARNNDNATNANLILLFNIAHDGTLAQYWQNATEGEAQDNATFAETIEFAAALPEAAADQLEEGASPALVSIAAEMAARNMISAIYVYQGNNAAAYQQGLAEARLILKAVNAIQSGGACGGANAMEYLEQVNMAAEAGAKAAESLSEADIQSALTAAQQVVNSPSRCASLAPALAPAASTTASTGRRML